MHSPVPSPATRCAWRDSATCTPSPVAAAGRVYVTDLEGVTLVLSDEETPRTLARNRLDEGISASAAIAGDAALPARQPLALLPRARWGRLTAPSTALARRGADAMGLGVPHRMPYVEPMTSLRHLASMFVLVDRPPPPSGRRRQRCVSSVDTFSAELGRRGPVACR